MMTMASNVTKNVLTFWWRFGLIINDAFHSLGHVTSFMKAPRHITSEEIPFCPEQESKQWRTEKAKTVLATKLSQLWLKQDFLSNFQTSAEALGLKEEYLWTKWQTIKPFQTLAILEQRIGLHECQKCRSIL